MLGFISIFLMVFVTSLFISALPVGYYVIWFDERPLSWSIYLLPPITFSIMWTGFVLAIWLACYFKIVEILKEKE